MKYSPLMYIRPRWRKVFSDLWSNKIRSILVVLSIGVGLFAVGMIANVHGIIIDDMVTGYQAINPANINIAVTSFDDDFADTVKRMDGVAEAETTRTFAARLKSGQDEYTRVSIKAIPDFDKMSINRPTLLVGTFPPKTKEIVLERHKFADTNAKVGEMVEIKLYSGKTRQLKLVGVVQDQSIGSVGVPYFIANLQGYITFDTLEWMEQPEKPNQLYATVAQGQEDPVYIQQVTSQIITKL